MMWPVSVCLNDTINLRWICQQGAIWSLTVFLYLQLNQSQSSVSGLLELLSGRRMLWSLGELAVIDSGYRQSLELKHSYSQV